MTKRGTHKTKTISDKASSKEHDSRLDGLWEIILVTSNKWLAPGMESIHMACLPPEEKERIKND